MSLDEQIKRLETLFGGSPLLWKSPQDPESAPCVQRWDRRRVGEEVLAVSCGSGLGALVATFDSGVEHLVSRNPVLRQGLRSGLESAFIFWVRIGSEVAKQNFLSNRGVELVVSGFVPVAVNRTKIHVLVDHEGPLIPLESIDLGTSSGNSTSCSIATNPP